MNDPSDLSAERAALRNALQELEAVAYKGNHRTPAVKEANDRLERIGCARPLKTGAVSKWFTWGDPATDFRFLWALVQVLRERAGRPPAGTLMGPYRGPAASEWQYHHELWKIRWEQAKLTPPRRTSLDEGLLRYLAGARAAAAAHPYLGLYDPDLDDAEGTPPPLTEVYVRQQSRPAAPDAHPGPRDDSPLEPAEVVFGNDARISVVIAGPGVGKSTLLRAQVRKAADQWLADKHSAGKRSRPVPVWVSARTLVGKTTHVHEGLAAASDVLPDHGRNPSLPPERFLQLPCAGAHWQLLVDGLDELPNASERRAVLEKLKTAIAEDPPLYRCVVATRPLPHNELGVLGDTASRYELQPFAPEDVHAYVGKYFNTRWPQPEATHRAEEFTSALRGASLAEPARTPLMAFMLCQLYLAQPERPLPAGRSAVYTQFTGLLYLHNKSREVADSHEQAMHHLLTDLQTAKARRKAAAAAKQIHEQLPELIDYLAYQWLTGQPTSAAEAVASLMAVHRPDDVPAKRWQAFLDDLLRHSGLLYHHADGLGFPHQTFLEYHAARYATRNTHARAHAGQALFRWTPSRDQPWPPGLEPSYVGFLLDQLLHGADARAVCDQWMTRMTDDPLAALDFLASQIWLRTGLPGQPTATLLTNIAVDPAIPDLSRVDAARTLASMDGYAEDALRLLGTLATDVLEHGAHSNAMRGLLEVGRRATGAANILTTLATDTAFNPTSRVQAAEGLTRLVGHTEKGARFLAALATNTTLENSDRVWAAQTLAGVEGYEDEGARLLATFMADTNVDAFRRIYAAQSLAKMPGHAEEGTCFLATFAADGNPDHVRCSAAKALAEVGEHDEEAARLLAMLATDSTVWVNTRAYAAIALAEFGGHAERAARLLALVVTDPALDSYVRHEAEGALARLRFRTSRA